MIDETYPINQQGTLTYHLFTTLYQINLETIDHVHDNIFSI